MRWLHNLQPIIDILLIICLSLSSSWTQRARNYPGFNPRILLSARKVSIDSTSNFKPIKPTVSSPAVSTGGAATIIKCDTLTKSFTGIPQFSAISLNVAKGQRVGLIGVNGAGKSTFLKCLCGLENADSGTIETASGSNVIYVDQEPDWGDIVVYEALFAGSGEAARTLRSYYTLLRDASNFANDAFTKISDAMETCAGWDYQERGLTIAEKLCVPESLLYRPVTGLSGGQRKRVSPSAALLKQPDVLLLDEVSERSS